MLATQTNYKTPYVYWGQNDETLFVSIKIDSPKDIDLQFEKNNMKLTCSSSSNINYQINMNLFDEIEIGDSSYTTKSQKIECILKKCEPKLWTLLTKNNQYKQFIKIDWDKWTEINKDDELVDTPIDMAELAKMQNMMQGMGGMPGMEGGMPGMEGGMPGMEGGMPGMPGMENFDYEQYMKETGNAEGTENDTVNDTKDDEEVTENEVIEIDTSNAKDDN